MMLNVLDRLLLLNVLPKEGDITTLRIIRKLQEDLSFSEAEHAALQFRKDETGLHWNPEGNVTKDIPIGAKAQVIVAEVLEKMSKDKKLTSEFVELYDQFVSEPA